ncbi:MAG: hypothetical protein WBL23_07525 [Salinisphaera sp.]|uniref:hypothetical protein n=1 Tax=Salinisphaera sp. TaxID=1914330 RepID=UPI003C7CB10A
MRNPLHKSILAGVALALTVIGGTASAATDLSDWDHNSDGYVSTDEFYGTVGDNGYYADWDTDGNGLLDQDEFNNLGVDDVGFDDWDTDDDGYLDSGEVYDGYYSYYDANEDGHWNNGEWDDAGEDGFFDI